MFLILFKAGSRAVALHITITASTFPIVDGSDVAGIFINLSPPWPSIFRPFLLISSTCSFQTSMSVTLRPFSARRPPNRQPIAPAPRTATFKSLLFIFKIEIYLCKKIMQYIM